MKIQLSLEANDSEEIEVRPLEDSRFELCETPLFGFPDVCCGDIVRLCSLGEDRYKIAKVVERPYGHWNFLIPGTYGASCSLFEFGDWVSSRGGRWECLMFGLLYIHLPAGGSIADVEAELRARVEQFLGSPEHEQLLKLGPPTRPPRNA